MAHYQEKETSNRVKAEGGVTDDNEELDHNKGSSANIEDNGPQQKGQDLDLTLPKMDTSSQVKKTIMGLTEPLKKERANKPEINKRNKVSLSYWIVVSMIKDILKGINKLRDIMRTHEMDVNQN